MRTPTSSISFNGNNVVEGRFLCFRSQNRNTPQGVSIADDVPNHRYQKKTTPVVLFSNNFWEHLVAIGVLNRPTRLCQKVDMEDGIVELVNQCTDLTRRKTSSRRVNSADGGGVKTPCIKVNYSEPRGAESRGGLPP